MIFFVISQQYSAHIQKLNEKHYIKQNAKPENMHLQPEANKFILRSKASIVQVIITYYFKNFH